MSSLKARCTGLVVNTCLRFVHKVQSSSHQVLSNIISCISLVPVYTQLAKTPLLSFIMKFFILSVMAIATAQAAIAPSPSYQLNQQEQQKLVQ